MAAGIPAGRRLGRSFFARRTETVARELLGSWLVRPTPAGDRIVRIVETEAYVANDPASHTYRGPTARNTSMFGPPGTLYVYRIHQVHCANVVTVPGQAVLLRAGEPVSAGLSASNGPGRLCRALDLTRSDDGSDLLVGPIRIVPGPSPTGPIAVGPRVGIRKARSRRLRFALRGNRYVSSPRPWGWRRRIRVSGSSASPSRTSGDAR